MPIALGRARPPGCAAGAAAGGRGGGDRLPRPGPLRTDPRGDRLPQRHPAPPGPDRRGRDQHGDAPGARQPHPLRELHHPRHQGHRPHPTPRGPRHRGLRPGPVGPRHREPRAEGRPRARSAARPCSTICRELRDRYRAFRARSLAEVRLLALMLDAIYLPVRPEGPKEGVLVAWGFTTDGERVLLDVCLGQRERLEDWLDLGRGLLRRGLRSPLLVVSDGAPGLIRAIAELWPDADRQRCSVHRLRNVLAKLPKRPGLHERVRAAYWAALDGATIPSRGRDGAAGPGRRAVGRSSPAPRPAWPRTCPH